MRGKRILITGASSGIGAALAAELGSREAELILLARGGAGLERAKKAAEARGGSAAVVIADVGDPDALGQAIDDAVAQLGGLDAVVINAGVAAYGLFKDIPPEDFDRTVGVTLLGAANTVRATLPHLERTAGTIVAVGSVASMWPQPLMIPYAAAKHGLRGFLNSLRLELRATGSQVKVALVHPGPVDTPFWKHATPSGVKPPELPRAYRPETVVDALVQALEDPRPERTLGTLMKLTGVLASVARPVFELGVVALTRWALNRPADVPPGQGLWEASGEGRVDGDVLSEPRGVESPK